MRVLCEAPQSPASMSPAVGVADGFPTPSGVEVWQRRNVQLIAIAIPGGMGINPYLIYISLSSRLPGTLRMVKKVEKIFCTYLWKTLVATALNTVRMSDGIP